MNVSADGGKDYLLHTQKKSNPPTPGLFDWENIRNNLDDGRSVVSYPKICNLFSRCLCREFFQEAIINDIPRLLKL